MTSREMRLRERLRMIAEIALAEAPDDGDHDVPEDRHKAAIERWRAVAVCIRAIVLSGVSIVDIVLDVPGADAPPRAQAAVTFEVAAGVFDGTDSGAGRTYRSFIKEINAAVRAHDPTLDGVVRLSVRTRNRVSGVVQEGQDEG